MSWQFTVTPPVTVTAIISQGINNVIKGITVTVLIARQINNVKTKIHGTTKEGIIYSNRNRLRELPL